MDEPNPMRKNILLAIAACFAFACQKEQEQISVKPSEEPISGDRIQYRRIECYEPYGVGGPKWCICEGTSGNCLPDVIVTRLHAPDIGVVLTAVRSGIQADIVNAFTTHRALLLNYVEKKDVDDVIAATLKATWAEGANNGQFILIRDLHDNVTAAYPLFIEE